MEPIFLKPVYKDYLWGGNKLKKEFNKDTPFARTAESWEISANSDGDNIIANGEYKGKLLSELFKMTNEKALIFGNNCANLKDFPILIKFIDANKDLSIQVHPDDEYARVHDNGQSGKNELWYIMEAEKTSKVVCGIKNCTKKMLPEILENGTLIEYLNCVNIEKGDSIYIPSGTVHAILAGVMICEIQQNSNLTYRFWDYNRVDNNGNKRELHINKAIDVIDFKSKYEFVKRNTSNKQNIINNKNFIVERINIDKKFNDISDPNIFYSIVILEGNGKLKTELKDYTLKKGVSFIIPACLGKYSITGPVTILKITSNVLC